MKRFCRCTKRKRNASRVKRFCKISINIDHRAVMSIVFRVRELFMLLDADAAERKRGANSGQQYSFLLTDTRCE
jgi:hypothetical protein